MWWIRRLFQSKQRQLLLLSCQIHGSHYYDCLNLLNQSTLHIGERLTLRREPDNGYDSHAIEVLTQQGKKLGYIPKHSNQVIAKLLDQNCHIEAFIDKILTTAWEPVSICVYLNKY